MKKKTKLFGTLTALCASICMMVVGVLAASQVSLNVTSSVSFESNGAYVKVKGEVQKGNSSTEPTLATEPENSDYYYIGYSYDAVDEELETDTQASDYNDTPVGTSSFTPMTAWAIGNVEFSENESIIRYSLTFTNYSEKPVQATITTNKDAFLSDPNVQGKVSISETSNSVIIDGYDGVTPQTATYSITLTLTNFSSSFSNVNLTLDVNFSTEIVEQEVEELVPGLMASVIEGTNNVQIQSNLNAYQIQNIELPETFNIAEKEFPSNFTMKYMDLTEIAAILLSFGDFNAIFDNGSNRELINYVEFMLEMQSGTIGEDFTITFELTFNLKIENNETDLAMLSLYAELISSNFSDGFLYELPKVKENGSTESIEFQSKEEFETYANNVSTSPETVNFPLEFQMTPPRYKAIVKGDDYIITSIWNSAFNGFSSLKSISIPNSVTNIGSNAFNSCTSLASIEIPSSVTSIGSNAFDGCSSLKYIRITGNLNSDYSLPSGTWVRTDTPDMPTDWTTNVVTSITAGDSIGYYHQRSAWQNAG